jgi:DNA-binding MarR family transcriptional regulator
VTDQHPADGLDDTVHQRHRLGVLVVLAEAKRADFAYLKQTLGLTDGNLGRHLQVLADAGLVEIDKVFEERRPRTWVTITRAGRKALAAEIDILQDLVERARNATE